MSVRRSAAIKVALGMVGTAVVGLLLYYARMKGYVPTSFAMIPLALPGAYALMGLLEFITNAPFGQIATRWDALAGWQRGILGMLVVIAAFGAAMIGMFVFGN